MVSRWLSVDPVVHPYESPYAAFENNPIYFIDPDGRKVKPLDKESMELVKKTVTPAESEYVQYDADGNIDVDMLRIGEAELESVSDNFCSLLETSSHKNVIELRVSMSHPTFAENPNNPTAGETYDFSKAPNFEFFNTELYSQLQDDWEMYGGNPNRTGSIGNGITFEEFKKHTSVSDEMQVSGRVGITLFPINSFFDPAIPTYSSNTNAQIYISEILFSGQEGRKVATKTLAHELYGHYLFYLRGVDHSHGSSRIIGIEGANDALEIQINDSERAAEHNYDLHEHN